jgi:hypothetical protein
MSISIVTNMCSIEVNIIELLTLRMATNDLTPRLVIVQYMAQTILCED